MASPAPKLTSAKPWPIPPRELQEAVRRRAHQIYEASGHLDGRHAENWVRAESEIRNEILRHYDKYAAPRQAIVVRVEGVRYVGEYSLVLSDGYAPGEWAAGDPVRVRFEGNKMYARRPNGKELKTTIVRTAP